MLVYRVFQKFVPIQNNIVNFLNKSIVFRTFSINRGREFKIAGNSNFSRGLDAFVSIFVPNVHIHVFPLFFHAPCVCRSFSEFVVIL